jgi:antagonist of KipI
VRAYLCIRGGVQTREVLGSRSSLNPLRAGERLPCFPGAIRPRSLGLTFEWNKDPLTLRVLDGAQAGWFTAHDFCSTDFLVTPSSNRMGLRLAGGPLSLPARELVSEPVCPGAVQVTHDGQCIVLGVDGQTIGGYPKIAQVASVDLDKLAQLRPGNHIRFSRVSLAAAEDLYQSKRAEQQQWLLRLRTTEMLVS